MDTNAQSLPPVPLSDTCGRLCIYMWMKTLRQSRYSPPPKPIRIRELESVFVVCSIVFMSIFTNVANHSVARAYTTLCLCKITNFLSKKYQNARKFTHIYDSLTLILYFSNTLYPHFLHFSNSWVVDELTSW